MKNTIVRERNQTSRLLSFPSHKVRYLLYVLMKVLKQNMFKLNCVHNWKPCLANVGKFLQSLPKLSCLFSKNHPKDNGYIFRGGNSDIFSPSDKGSIIKRNKLLPVGANCFRPLFRIPVWKGVYHKRSWEQVLSFCSRPLFKRVSNAGKQTGRHKDCLPWKKTAERLPNASSPHNMPQVWIVLKW